MEKIIHVKLLASKMDVYSLYVFKNLDTNDFIMCTKLPNWELPTIQIGEKGFLKHKSVIAGEKYFNPTTETEEVYKYTNIYLIAFIKETDIITNNNTIINL